MDLGARLKGRHVLVTGASGGLGEHFARLCARCGAAVTIAARRRDRLEALAGELREAGAAHTAAIALDVADEASIEAAFAALERRRAPRRRSSTTPASPAAGRRSTRRSTQFDRIIATNLRGVWLDVGRGGAALARRASVRGVDRQHRLDPRPARHRRHGAPT